MSKLAPFVRILGRGPGRARHLTAAEAEEAMRLVLSGRAAPEAVGALLMLMRYRGEAPEEVAGFVRALRQEADGWNGLPVALDWPSYAAGRTRGLPWFLLAARLIAEAGHPMLIHGWNSHQGELASVRAALEPLDIPVVTEPEAARGALLRIGIAYASLADVAPQALRVLRLRDVLGLRSAVNTALRLLNPAGAPASVQGVFHPPYRPLGRDAALLLGQERILVIEGGGGEFERHPSKAVTVSGAAGGQPFETTAPALLEEAHRLADDAARPDDLMALWTGARADPFAEAVVIGTAPLALLAIGAAADPEAAAAEAAALWRRRARQLAA
jgi:anthranilate phosphoribosyltransferase